MIGSPHSRDCIDSTIPVFLVARIDNEVYSTLGAHLLSLGSDNNSQHQCLNKFFTQVNAACRLCEYEEAQSTLMYSEDVALVEARTEPPVQDRLLLHWPFLGHSCE
jgi:hypothetical protein